MNVADEDDRKIMKPFETSANQNDLKKMIGANSLSEQKSSNKLFLKIIALFKRNQVSLL
jgi:hypothetical protein